MSNVRQIKPNKIAVILDKERHLLFDLNAFAELEDLYGSVDNAMDALDSGSIKVLRKLLWLGLIHEDEELTERQVGAMLDMPSVNILGELINEALTAQMPQKGEEGN